MAVKPTKPCRLQRSNVHSGTLGTADELEAEAVKVMAALEAFHLPSVTHGSVARGDVKKGSDVDVFIGEVQNSFLVETALEKAGVPINAQINRSSHPNIRHEGAH